MHFKEGDRIKLKSGYYKGKNTAKALKFQTLRGTVTNPNKFSSHGYWVEVRWDRADGKAGRSVQEFAWTDLEITNV